MIFKDEYFLDTQEQSVSVNRKSGKNVKKSVWINKELLAKLKLKKEARRGWKQVQEGIQRHRLGIQESVRKAKLQIELNLAKDVKENRKGFYTYFCDKRKTG